MERLEKNLEKFYKSKSVCSVTWAKMPFVMVKFGEFEFAININFRYVSENMFWEGKCETGETI